MGDLVIVYPFDGSLFPPEIIPPTFIWRDDNPASSRWSIRIGFEDGDRLITAVADSMVWTPSREVWEVIKRRSKRTPARVTISGLKRFAGIERMLSAQTISIATSEDSVGAPIFYRDVPLPFRFAIRNLHTIRWRLGDIASEDPPATVMTGLKVCANCHSFSADGKTFGMDADVAGDKGGYILLPFEEETNLTQDRLITWTGFDGELEAPTFGLLASVSPDGRYVLSGAKDRAVFLPRLELYFSQIFFPVTGILVVYDRQSGRIRPLPGADQAGYVQCNGTWMPDGKSILFARNRAAELHTINASPSVSLNRNESAEVLGGEQYLEGNLDEAKKFCFDLYRVPFGEDASGKAEAVPGASQNGMSNFFPKISPDGKWLVFTMSKSYMMLQPDSRLVIMPAAGGRPRPMRCNTDRMNSWHSWSPNGRWLVFSSKAFTPYTQLFLTHIDEDGQDTPPVLLKNFTDQDRAANIPEFVNIRPGSRRMMHPRWTE